MNLRAISIAIVSCIALSATGAALAGGKGGGSSKSGGGKSSKSAGADYRSAKSGQYVKKDYADKNKDTTVREGRK